jgi:hypothetical protein
MLGTKWYLGNQTKVDEKDKKYTQNFVREHEKLHLWGDLGTDGSLILARIL